MSVTTDRPSELVSILQSDFVNGQVPIEQVTLSASQAQIEFDDIGTEFRTLMLVTQLRTDYASGYDFAEMQFNGDTSQVYSQIRVTLGPGESGSLGLGIRRNSRTFNCLITEASGSLASTFAPGIAWIPGYKLEDRHKRVIALSGALGSLTVDTDLRINLSVCSFGSVDQITSIVIRPFSGNFFVSGSKIDLYGVV